MKNKEITIYELMGLIKDGKSPKKIKYNGKEYYYNFGDYYSVKDINLFNNIELKLKSIRELLEVTVEILPEENDEWEDIEELQEEGNFKFYNKPTGMSEEVAKILDAYLETLIIKINSLIKNQKYLKEKLESKNEK